MYWKKFSLNLLIVYLGGTLNVWVLGYLFQLWKCSSSELLPFSQFLSFLFSVMLYISSVPNSTLLLTRESWKIKPHLNIFSFNGLIKLACDCMTWHVTCDMWHVTCDKWHLTRDIWHVTLGERWTFSQNFRSPAHTVWKWRCLEYLEEKDHLMNSLQKCL